MRIAMVETGLCWTSIGRLLSRFRPPSELHRQELGCADTAQPMHDNLV